MIMTDYGIIAPKFKKALDEGAFQPDFTAPAEQLRASFDSNEPSPSVEGVEEESLNIAARDDHPMNSRVWRPAGASRKEPLIVLIHPGGHVLGNHRACEDDARRLVRNLSCVCLAADYRRGPEDPFPKAIKDAFDAIRWAAANASNIGADLAKGFLLQGTSAGGNVAAVAALIARDEKLSPPLTGIMLINPFLISPEAVPDKYKDLYKSWDQCQEAPLVPRKAVVALQEKYKPDKASWLFNPGLHPDGLGGLPPTYFQLSGYDPFRDDGLIYSRILREEYDIQTKVDVYAGLPHLFWIAYSNELPTEASKSRTDMVNGAAWLLGAK